MPEKKGCQQLIDLHTILLFNTLLTEGYRASRKMGPGREKNIITRIIIINASPLDSFNYPYKEYRSRYDVRLIEKAKSTYHIQGVHCSYMYTKSDPKKCNFEENYKKLKNIFF